MTEPQKEQELKRDLIEKITADLEEVNLPHQHRIVYLCIERLRELGDEGRVRETKGYRG
jgi:hypothetical protein